ncbi:MAG TPA: hypothetical protein VNJ01_18370 [Bacteriovoracaceae bacterium]|nr:hypothetical protein [Bacteriovoracaceae bacterium]
MLQIDNINSCTRGGACTELASPTFIGKLIRSSVTSISTLSFYEMKLITGSAEYKKLAARYYVVADLNGSTEVVAR